MAARKVTPKTNAQAIEQTLAELDRMGRLEKIDAARVQALRSIAAALDENPLQLADVARVPGGHRGGDG